MSKGMLIPLTFPATVAADRTTRRDEAVPTTSSPNVLILRTMDDWSSSSPLVISSIATALKRTRQWRCSGPSLRLLNKHWSQVVDSNIVEVRPGRGRRIDADDVASLLKFPRLSTVDISPFLSFEKEPAEESSEACSPALFPPDLFLSNLEYVVETLVRLPLLHSLELDCEVMFGSSKCDAEASRFWSKLTGIVSVLVYFVRNPKRDDPGFYIMNPTLRSQCVTKFNMHSLQAFADAFSGLQVLEMNGFLSCVTGLDTFLFTAPAPAKDFLLVGLSFHRNCGVDASCITSVSLRGPGVEELFWTATLPQLKQLHIADLDA